MDDMVVKAGVLVLIIATGLGAKRLGWVAASDFETLTRIALRITLPCALITSFNTFEVRPSMLAVAAWGFAVVLAAQVLSFVVESRRGPRAQAFGILNVGSFNIGLFALPYVSTLIGPEAVVIVSLFDIGNALAIAGLAYGWGLGLASGKRRSPWGYVRQVFNSPVFITYLALLVIRLAGLTFPPPVIAFTSTVGAANTFVAMFMIGVGLELVLDRGRYAAAARYLAQRYAIVVVAGLVMWFLLPFSPLEKAVLCTVLTAPMAAMVSGFTAEAGLDVPTSTFMTSVTVLIAIVAMPLVLTALS